MKKHSQLKTHSFLQINANKADNNTKRENKPQEGKSNPFIKQNGIKSIHILGLTNKKESTKSTSIGFENPTNYQAIIKKRNLSRIHKK